MKYFPGVLYANPNNGTFAYTTSGSNATIVGYVASDTIASQIVVIPTKIGNYTVTSVASHAFQYSNALYLDKNIHSVGIRDITLADSVTNLGDYAFQGLDLLTRLTISATSQLSLLGEGAFAFCPLLANLFIPSGITSIPANCFYHDDALGAASRLVYSYTEGASALTSASETIGAAQRGIYGSDSSTSEGYSHALPSLISFREAAFAYCKSLASFSLPKNVDFIDNYCFRDDTKLKTFTFNTVYDSESQSNISYLRKIGDYAFQGCTGFAQSGASCDFSSSKCPYLEDVGITVFKDCDLTVTDDDGNTTTSSPAFITQTAPFYYAYGWAIEFDATSSLVNSIVFSIPEGTYGLARDVLSQIPGCHNESGTWGVIDLTHAIQVTIPASLVHASNNFIRFSGDDLNKVNCTVQSDISGETGLAFSRLYSSAYKAVTVTNGNSHFQVLDVSVNGSGNTSNGGSTVDSSKYGSHQLVNYYIGLNPKTKAKRAEARLITSTRYAHWNALDSFTTDTGAARVSVLSPENSTLFATLNGYNGNDTSGTANSNYKIHGYTILSAQSGQGCSCLYNDPFASDSTYSYYGSSKITSSDLHTNGTNPQAQIRGTGATLTANTLFSSSNKSQSYKIKITLNGTVTTYPTMIAHTLKVYALNKSGNVVGDGYGTISFDATGSFSKSVTFSLNADSTATTTYAASGLKIVCDAYSGSAISLTTMSAVLYHSNTSTSANDVTFESSHFTSSGSVDFITQSGLADYCLFIFGKDVREIEDHVFESYIYTKGTTYEYFFLRSSLEYVGRDLTAGSLILQGTKKKDYFALQDSTFNEDWSRFLGITSTLSESGKDPAPLETSSYFSFGTTGTYDGYDFWEAL